MGDQGRGQAEVPSAISAGIVISGNVRCAGDLQISGKVEGEVHGDTIFVEQGGVVDGAVHAKRLRVCGSVKGVISVQDLAIEDGGAANGEISYNRLKVASGGVIEGMLKCHTRVETPPEEQPLKLVPHETNPRKVFVD